ncbi:GerMN domain-containing protein [Humibacillus xanthopallidus]|uniref:GerMN domain-containing protein n=1 Tax=Humibacillus xanthopallidus TaxID=412689 RepID=UPI003850CFB0
MRRRLLAAAALAVSLVLTACGGLPESGPVIEGRALGEAINEPVRVAATGPRDGASQEEVVRGFLRAGEDSDETRQTGKLFLAPQSVDLWRWSTQDVVIYDSDLSVRKVDEETVQVRATEVARLGPDGRYTEQPSGTKATLTLGVRKVGGEWRIDLPREGFGLWLDSDQFDRTFTARMVYFVTPSGRDLVPDFRWFPNGPRLATTLARAQLGRVPDYLQNAVVTGVPANTRLAVNAVPVVGGRAQVSLSSEALSADPDDRTAMWAQLTATLSQVSSVSSVSLAVDDTPLELPRGVSSAGSAAELGYDTVTNRTFDTALLRQGDELSRLDPRFLPDTTVGSRRADTKPQDGDIARIPDTWTRLALSADGKQVAAVSTGRQLLSLWKADAPQVVVPPFASSLTAPVYDEQGYLWVGGAGADGDDRIYVLDPRAAAAAATPVAVKAPWLKDRRVVSLAVAGDGVRLLVITTNRQGTDAQLGVSGIQRSPNGQPMSLATPLRQAQPLLVLTDVVWLDTTRSTYAVLGQVSEADPPRPWVGTIGLGLEGIRSHGRSSAESARTAPVPGAVSLTTVGGPRGIIVTTADDWAWARAGSAWRQVVRATDVLVPAR